jgi:apolipoprotein N-acyltransferase
MKRGGKRASLVEILLEIGLLLCSVVLFALSFPSFVSDWGWFPLGFAALVPMFAVIHRAGWIRVFLYGGLFGFLSYALFNYWLVAFHPLAIFIVPVIYAVYFIILFPLLKGVDTLFPRYGYLAQAVIWVGYEYLRTKGFLGYSYGILGYTQYMFLPFARFSALTGIWGVTLLTVIPSAYLGNALKEGFSRAKSFLREHRWDAVVYGAVFAAVLVYGFAVRADLEDAEPWRTALIQHNVDPWKHDYEDSLDILIDLSERAEEKDPDIVVWSETAFVPAIEYHTRHRNSRKYYELISRLIEFLEEREVPYILGNDDGQLERVGGRGRIDYNAALLFEEGRLVDRYWKTHLVPFTEHFPFEKRFPRIHAALVDADTHFWEKGEEYTVFDSAGVKFSTPICFEDTFGYLSRNFILSGAEVIVNLTNDSWSFSVAAEMQHMAMSRFRAMENRRSMVRSTNGGITCIIDPNGRIVSSIDPFIEGYLVAETPVYTATTTLYTRWGDWFGVVMTVGAGLFLLLGIGLKLLNRRRRIDNSPQV